MTVLLSPILVGWKDSHKHRTELRGSGHTHDYKRSGTSSLYAALNITTGWLNLVERWFAELTDKKLRRGTHRSVRQLNSDITAWIETWNENPKPFVWTKTALSPWSIGVMARAVGRGPSFRRGASSYLAQSA